MKIMEMRFENERDRNTAVLALIAIREKIAEPVFAEKKVPALMVWEAERKELEKQMEACGIQYRIDHETEIPESTFMG